MKPIKVIKEKLKYLGRECLVTTVNYTNIDGGKRLAIRKFIDGVGNDVKLMEGFYGRYEKKLPFKTFSKEDTDFAYKEFIKEEGERDEDSN